MKIDKLRINSKKLEKVNDDLRMTQENDKFKKNDEIIECVHSFCLFVCAYFYCSSEL